MIRIEFKAKYKPNASAENLDPTAKIFNIMRIVIFTVTLYSVYARKRRNDNPDTIVNCDDSNMKIFFKTAEYEKRDKCIVSSSSKDEECQPYYNHNR